MKLEFFHWCGDCFFFTYMGVSNYVIQEWERKKSVMLIRVACIMRRLDFVKECACSYDDE